MMSKEEIKDLVIAQLQEVFDPEIPVNIWDLGLIYDVQVYPPLNNVFVLMTLTAPNCPVADTLPIEVKVSIEQIEGVGDVEVEMTFEPTWHKGLMSEEAQVALDIF